MEMGAIRQTRCRITATGRQTYRHLFCGTEPEPPPYPINKTQAAKIFGKYFRLLRDLKVSDSVPMFAGMERWQEWERTAMK